MGRLAHGVSQDKAEFYSFAKIAVILTVKGYGY
jgi:hypothetical protein